MTITAENIHDDVLANLGNRDDIDTNRIYRMINYSQLAIARLTKWRDLIQTIMFSQSSFLGTSNAVIEDTQLSVVTLLGISPASRLRSVMTFFMNSPVNIHDNNPKTMRLLKRVSSYHEWDKVRDTHVGQGLHRGTPTHYFFTSKGTFELFPCPDYAYYYGIRCVVYPVEITVSNKTLAMTLSNCEDLITARTSYVLAAGLNMQDIARMWQGEYQSMLSDVYQAEKDVGDIDFAAFRAEMNGNTSYWWSDPFSIVAPQGGFGEQV